MPQARGQEQREALARLLAVNGEAGDVETDSDGSPVFQVFVAQAGPLARGTAVCVLSQGDAERIAAILRERDEPLTKHEVEDLALACRHIAPESDARHAWYALANKIERLHG